MIIDGSTQPGFSGTPLIELDGGSAGLASAGLTLVANGNTIRGLALYQLQRSFWLYGSGASNNTIVGCFVGTNAAGTYGSPTLELLARKAGIDLDHNPSLPFGLFDR